MSRWPFAHNLRARSGKHIDNGPSAIYGGLSIRSGRSRRPSTLPNVEHSSTTSPQGSVHEESLVKSPLISAADLEAHWCNLGESVTIGHCRTCDERVAAECVSHVDDFARARSRPRSPRPRRPITRVIVRLASTRSRLSATLQPLAGLTALTGPSGEPTGGCCVMGQQRPISQHLIADDSSLRNSMPWSRSYGFSWSGTTVSAQ